MVVVLAKVYKVEMQEVSEQRQLHTYLHKDVTIVVPPPTDAPDAESAAAGASATATGGTGDILTPGEAVTAAASPDTGANPVPAPTDASAATTFHWENYTFVEA